MQNEIRWMRVDSLSTYTGIGISTLWKMVKDGRIKSKKFLHELPYLIKSKLIK